MVSLCKGIKIPKSEFLNAIKIILDSTFFKFNNKIYKQNFGTSILLGYPLSPIIADIVMQDLEKRALEGFINEIPFYYTGTQKKNSQIQKSETHFPMYFDPQNPPLCYNRSNFPESSLSENLESEVSNSSDTLNRE